MARKPYLTKHDLLRELRISKERYRTANIDVTAAECVTPQLATYFMTMTKRYASKGSFCGYTWLDEMVSEALLTLVSNALKFDEDKSDNPFAYYTAIIHRSFLTYLKKERTLRDVKDSMLEHLGQLPSYHRQLKSSNAQRELNISEPE